jgi:hypothetical protein
MKLVEVPEPWKPAHATERIRAIARSQGMSMSWKKHVVQRLTERDLIMGDLHYLLRNGFVYEAAEEATRKPYWKYQIQCTTPNSKGREVRAVIIPDWQRKCIKVVTIMWADEPMVRGG